MVPLDSLSRDRIQFRISVCATLKLTERATTDITWTVVPLASVVAFVVTKTMRECEASKPDGPTLERHATMVAVRCLPPTDGSVGYYNVRSL